jgi:acetoin utilization protein AcuB
MFANQLLSTDLFPLKPSDTVETCLLFMADWKVAELPVVESGNLIGYVSETSIRNQSTQSTIQAFVQPIAGRSIPPALHLFDILKRMRETELTCLAVVAETQYLGAITFKELIRCYQQSALVQPGGTIVLRMKPQDYALGEIARIMEYNDAKILHVFITPEPTSAGDILVSLKLNKSILNTVYQTLSRYAYEVVGVYDPSEGDIDDKQMEWFLKYLNT